MIVHENKEGEKIQEVAELLQLTPKNLELLESFLDMSQPENQELLKQVEHQDFTVMELNSQQSVNRILGYLKRNNEELQKRFIRFIMEVGGATARRILVYYGWNSEFKYLETVLSPLQATTLYADWVAWNASAQCASSIAPLIEQGQKDPEIFPRIRELCYDEDACNTEMFLAGMYLHCVKPLEESRSLLYVPLEESGNSADGGEEAKVKDGRAEGNPDRIREMRDYLAARLRGNAAGLFVAADEPKDEDEEKLKEFILNSDPGETFPYEIRALISGRSRHGYRMVFLPFLAFLAVEHSNQFISLIRLAVAIDSEAVPNGPLDVFQKAGDQWFHNHILPLEQFLWISDEAYMRWGILRKEKEVCQRMMVKAPETIHEVIKNLSAKDFGYLVAQVKTGNPKLYEEVGEALRENYLKIAAAEDVKGYEPSGDKAMDYLMGVVEIQDILPYVEQWRELYFYDGQKNDRIHEFLDYGEEQLYRRSLVLECLRLRDGYFRRYWASAKLEREGVSVSGNKNMDRRQIEGILNLFEEEQVPAQYQIEYFGQVYESYYNASVFEPGSASQICVLALKELRGEWHQEWEEASYSRFLPARILAYRVMGERGEEYKNRLLACSAENAKQARDFLRAIYTNHPEWEADILEMLKAGKSNMREMAAEVLQNWGAEQYREPLSQALEAEKAKKVKTLLQEILNPGQQTGGGANSGDGQENTGRERTLDEIVKDILMGGRKRKLAWLFKEKIAGVHKLNGEEASEDYMAAFLVSYADMSMLGVNAEASRLAAELVPGELAAYVSEIYNRWMEDGAEAKRKWVLYAASIHGGEKIVPVLYAQIQEWPKHSRGAMAAEAVKALALNGTATALLQVDQIARKFKFRQVKAAAGDALAYAAEQLGISKLELEDRIVPNLGFDEGMERIFDYGKRQFKVLLTPTLSLEVYDANGKALKNLPSPGKTDDPELSKAANEAWKLLKKQLKTVVANQKIRLEQAMRIERRWDKEKWCQLFVKNPVMHQFAIGLVWGVYQEGALAETFRYMEDGTFNTAEEEEYELPEVCSIGLVHPIELSEEILGTWKEQLSDYEIVQPIEQMERPVYRVTEEEKEATDLIRFGGMVLNGLSLSGKLQDMGWYRGEVLDGGCYYTFYREDQDKGVELSFSGCYVGDENDMVTVYEAFFYQPGVTEKAGWTNQPVKQKLRDVEQRYFSEVVLQITKATASSEKRLPYPDCKK